MRSEARVTKRIVVLVSGNGGNLQAILDAVDDGRLAAHVVGVVSNRPAVRALQRATTAGVPTAVVEAQPAETRVQYDERLRDVVEAWEPDIVVLAGFMRVLSPVFLDAFPQAVVNIHPRLARRIARNSRHRTCPRTSARWVAHPQRHHGAPRT